jgi:hypothetical protein
MDCHPMERVGHSVNAGLLEGNHEAIVTELDVDPRNAVLARSVGVERVCARRARNQLCLDSPSWQVEYQYHVQS